MPFENIAGIGLTCAGSSLVRRVSILKETRQALSANVMRHGRQGSFGNVLLIQRSARLRHEKSRDRGPPCRVSKFTPADAELFA